jgi:hypothetical protein
MGQPLNAICEVRLESTVNVQKCLTVLTYAVQVPSTLAQLAEELGILNDILPAAPHDLVTPYLACCSPDLNLDRVVVQFVWPTRLVFQPVTVNAPGTRVGACNAQNIHGTIERSTLHTGRSQRSNIRPPGMVTDDAVAGAISAGLKTALNTFGIATLQVIAPVTGGGQYAPVIWHKHVVSPAPYDFLVQSFTQATVRTQHRRTVGVGR